jgi:DNA-binding transcriptional MerR regulator
MRSTTETHALLRIGEFAQRSGVTLRTLRYYEELGLIRPVPRTIGASRRYSTQQLERVETVRRLQSLGLSLREIVQLVKADPGPQMVQQVKVAVHRQISLLRQRIDAMQKDLVTLEAAHEKLLVCERCDVPLSLDSCDPCPQDLQPMSAMLRALL